MRVRKRFIIKGIVQGVGFRPFVFGLARRLGLSGLVWNDATGVVMEVEGEQAQVEAFAQCVRYNPPPLAVIDHWAVESLPLRGDTSFTIAPSRGASARQVFVSPDVSVCEACLAELFDPHDRRYRYPFINCTNCGPRFTIIRDLPYDRPQTTMADFPLCAACRREYEDPANRRFHAQPIACPECGPYVALVPATRERHTVTAVKGDAAIRQAQTLLHEGAILAIKGLGGYHLACDATNPEAVSRLRQRKHRVDKPLALMARDLATVETCCQVSAAEQNLLLSRQRPIVLLRKRHPCRIAAAVAPGQDYLGIMLPYTPLHYLLLEDSPPALVMTSGNLSDEPIIYRDGEALERLWGVADAFLVHNRPIYMRCDDSVVFHFPHPSPGDAEGTARATVFIRRARGYAPQPVEVPWPFRQPVLAVGGHLKNTFCLGKGRHAFVSHHLGDMENLETLASFRAGVEHYRHLFDVMPEVLAHDLHPGYLTTQYAIEWADRVQQQGDSVTRVAVQHHHAHIAGVMAEHGLSGPVIGVALDGTGYGPDGTIWGGEFLVADCARFERAAHLREMPLPGGEAAIRQPWRLAAALLYDWIGADFLDLRLPFVEHLDRARWRVLRQMIDQAINTPRTSSMGRLFDAVAALLGIREVVHYEGQAAMELEMLADASAPGSYRFELEMSWPMVLDSRPVWMAIVEDLQHGVELAIIAQRFHRAVAGAIVDVSEALREKTGCYQVALSGGVFQNRRLLHLVWPALQAAGFEPYINLKVPTNDGGLSLGQAVVANAIVSRGVAECVSESLGR